MDPGIPFEIPRPLHNFHVAIGGRRDSEANSNADPNVDVQGGFYFVRAEIQNFGVFSSTTPQFCLNPKRNGRPVKLSMLRILRAAVAASELQIAIKSLSM